MKHRQMALVLAALTCALSLLPTLGAAPAHAAPASQADPVEQCAEGFRLVLAGEAAAALPLLEAGFAGREQATFDDPDDLGFCALSLGNLRDEAGDLRGALEAYPVALAVFHRSGDRQFEGMTLSNMA